MSDIKYNKIHLVQRALYDFLLLEGKTLTTKIHNSSLKKLGDLYAKRTNYEITKLLINPNNTFNEDKFYNIYNSKSTEPYYIIGEQKNNLTTYLLFDQNSQIHSIKIGENSENKDIWDLFEKLYPDLLNNLTVLCSKNKKISIKHQKVEPDSIASVYFFTLAEQITSNQNIKMCCQPDINKEDLGLTNDYTNALGKIKKKELKILKEYNPEAINFINECINKMNENFIDNSIKIYEIDNIKSYDTYTDKVTFFNINTPVLSDSIKTKKVILNQCSIDKIGNHIECNILQINHSTINHMDIDHIQCNMLLINTSNIPEDFLNRTDIPVVINGIGHNEKGIEYINQEKERKLNYKNHCLTKESFDNSPKSYFDIQKENEFIINPFGLIDNTGFRFYDYIIPDVEHKLFRKNIDKHKYIYNIASNEIAFNFVTGCLNPLTMSSIVKLHPNYPKPVNTLAFHNKNASTPYYILTDGSYSEQRKTMLAGIILDKDYNIHSIIAGKHVNKIPHEESAFLLVNNYLNSIGYEDLSEMTWFTDISVDSAQKFLKQYKIDINIESHCAKYKSLTSTLFIDGICHQICANALLSKVLNNSFNYIRHKYVQTYNKNSMFTSMIKENFPSIYNNIIEFSDNNSIDFHPDHVFMDSKIIAQTPQLQDIQQKNITIPFLKIKKIENLDINIQELNINNFHIEDTSIDYFANKINADKIIIKDCKINELATICNANEIIIISSTLEKMPDLSQTKKLTLINSPEIEQQIIKNKYPNLEIIISDNSNNTKSNEKKPYQEMGLV